MGWLGLNQPRWQSRGSWCPWIAATLLASCGTHPSALGDAEPLKAQGVISTEAPPTVQPVREPARPAEPEPAAELVIVLPTEKEVHDVI